VSAVQAALREIRSQLGLTQSQAAECCGVSQPTWAQWESGARGLSCDRLERIAEALGCELRVALVRRR